jgi:GrpB-like predicted nucleotidyltransferase (UPF0157 family)
MNIKLTRIIRVVQYDPKWPRMFRQERSRLGKGLNEEAVQIYHIGSTAVPGIKAKPIIDILIVVRNISNRTRLEQAMTDLGYTAKGEAGIPGRLFFIKGSEESRSHHVHIFQEGHPEIQRHLDFVAYLAINPEEAQRYSELKEALALHFPTDIDSYTEGKTQLILELDERAKSWRRSQSGNAL